ncbi:MAG: restriction endonuclease subunit S [Candidatus Pacebacteria bacterium]|nr:restriction endonuclease subunit S [Candidatus Paceibacterota bacterium]
MGNNNTAIFAEIPAGWYRSKLGDICERGGGIVQTGPFGSQLHASDYVSCGVPSVMPINICDGHIIEAGIKRVTEKDVNRLARHQMPAGNIVFARRGDVERCALVREEQAGWLCGTGCLRLDLGHGVLVPEFAFYYLRHPDVRSWIVAHAVGSTMPNLNTSIISSLPVIYPKIAEQQAVIGVLRDLDDKIELNRKMNETLEETARAIFRSWFVDFDPVVAKAEGTQPTHMSPETAALFPDSFEESEIGPIPAGWRIDQIGNAVKCVGGGTPRTTESRYWIGGVHLFATPRDMSRLATPVLLDTERHITDAGVGKISSGQLPAGTVLLSSRAPIGYLAVAETPVSVNQGIIAMVCDMELPNSYVLHWTRENMDEILSRAGGTTFAEISKRNFRPVPALIPEKNPLAHFTSVVEPLHRRIVENVRESTSLAAIRDTLLPKLTSGEIRLRQAEELVEEAL